jgi:hypothetical protein
MGNKLFGVNISGLVAKHIGPGLLPAVITVITTGSRTSLTGGRSKVPTTYTARGIWEDVDPSKVDGEQILATDRVAMLIGDTIQGGVIAKLDDRITIEGITLNVVRLLNRDPAAATYRYLCRDRAGLNKT